MKREEMVDRIRSTLSILSLVEISNKHKAEAILSMIEEQGMLPPKTIVLIRTFNDEFETEVNSWDDV